MSKKRFFSSRPWYIVVSIFLALLLFMTATANSANKTGSQISGTTETYTHTLTNVPIDIKYDSDKYFVSGYSYEAEVYLTSMNRVKLDSEINADTRKFKVVADLTKVDSGTQTAKLEVTDLPNGVTATVSPTTIQVTIGKKKTKSFEVKGSVDSSQVAEGYEIKQIETADSRVDVTSDEATINKIDHVVAKLPEEDILSDDFSGKVTLQAVSADGTILASIIDPSKTTLKVAVKKLSKVVPVQLKVTGNMNDKLSKIDYKLSQDMVTISGTKEALEAVSAVTATVDISDVMKNTVKTVNLSAENVTVDPSVVQVQLTTTKK